MRISSVDVLAGNEAAHHGSLETDVRVFDQEAMNEDDFRAFELIYGMPLLEARDYTSMCPTPKSLIFLAFCLSRIST